jgi:transposase
MKITDEQSKEIYVQSKSTTVISTNTEIAKKYGISEGAVRKHIKKWESTVHEVAKNNEKVNAAVTESTLNVIDESLMQISNIKSSIQMARNQGVSPEKLPGLFNSWIRALELHSELLGAIRSGPDVQVNVLVTNQLNSLIQDNQTYQNFMQKKICPACKIILIQDLEKAV